MAIISKITKVSDGPSEDAILNVNLLVSGPDNNKVDTTTLLDVSTLDAPSGQVVKAVSLQEIWFSMGIAGGAFTAVEFAVLDSNNRPIFILDGQTDNHIDFTNKGCYPGLPDSRNNDAVGNTEPTGDLNYAFGQADNTNFDGFSGAGWVRVATGSNANVTLRLRKIYEDA